MYTIAFQNSENAVTWGGLSLAEGDEFSTFMTVDVASRLHDEAGKADFALHLSSLASTGFAQDSLKAILDADHPEERDWVGNCTDLTTHLHST